MFVSFSALNFTCQLRGRSALLLFVFFIKLIKGACRRVI